MGPFVHSLRALRADTGHATLWTLLCAASIFCAWWAWAAFARVSLYEISSDARIELDGATYPIDSPFLGRIGATYLRVGQPVKQGDLLVEIDAMPEQLRWREAQVELQGLEPQLVRLRSQIDAEANMRLEEEHSARLMKLEAESRRNEAEVLAKFAERELERMRKLYEQHIVSTHDFEKVESESGRQRLAVSTLDAAVRRVPQEQAARNREHDVRIAKIQAEIATLQAQHATLQADTERLAYEMERRQIRAPVDGRVGEAPNLRAGAVVAQGDRLGSIVPAGSLVVVAQFPAQAALGRIRPGQVATLRLEGFPWVEFGTVAAIVNTVAQDTRDGKVRVQLILAKESSFRGHLEHGMPGTLEVLVERISPLAITMRTAGQWLSRPL